MSQRDSMARIVSAQVVVHGFFQHGQGLLVTAQECVGFGQVAQGLRMADADIVLGFEVAAQFAEHRLE